MNALQYVAFEDELEKIAKEKDKRTFPISRFLTGSPTYAGLGAVGGASAGLGAGLGVLGGAPFSKLPAAAVLGGLPGAAIGGGIGYGAAQLMKFLNARAMRGRLRKGGKALTKTERALLREAAKGK